jgi:glycosidase
MPSSLDDAEVLTWMEKARTGALPRRPFPSPVDWRDVWIYFALIDRFARHDGEPPRSRGDRPPVEWDGVYAFRQGGTLEGLRRRLPYLERLGARALWLSPVLKNPRPPEWPYNYHGYAAQSFLDVDERLGSDGTRGTAERELRALVDDAHDRGMYVILDIVLNHAARVFDYVVDGRVEEELRSERVMGAPLGQEPPIRWLDRSGAARAEWEEAVPGAGVGLDDAVWPSELQRRVFFRRRGVKLGDAVPAGGGFVRGDFGPMRQLVVEYDAAAAGDQDLLARHGRFPVLDILVKAHTYLIARYDFDGFRIDTVKYVDPEGIESFGNAVREFALSIGKANFFTFAEVYDDEENIAAFVGRNGEGGEGFGVDAALDFPLFYQLPGVAKGMVPVEAVRDVFARRLRAERELLSSHGEAGRYFVTFLDNHDQAQRIRHPDTPAEQVTLALGALFTLQGIPCLYYGTEQGLTGTRPDRPTYEGVREALWGKAPDVFSDPAPPFEDVRALAALRAREPALRYGRLYFRPASQDGVNFGLPRGRGGVLAYSRILAGREVLIAANCGGAEWRGFVTVDLDHNRAPRRMKVAYSNLGASGAGQVELSSAVFWDEADRPGAPALAARLFVILRPGELQVLVPV